MTNKASSILPASFMAGLVGMALAGRDPGGISIFGGFLLGFWVTFFICTYIVVHSLKKH